METITLQIKRVTGDWDKHKDYKPAPGEPVLIALTDNEGFNVTVHTMDNGATITGKGGTSDNPLLVIGTTGDKDLQTLINERCFHIDIGTINSMITYSIAEWVETTSDPSNISNAPFIGKSNTLSRADHTHKLERNTAETVLNTNINITSSFNCRRIKAGTRAPSNADGEEGDIFILYMNNGGN